MKGIIGDDVLFDFMYFFYFIMILYGFLQMESNNLKEQLQKISMISHLFIMYYLLFIIYYLYKFIYGRNGLSYITNCIVYCSYLTYLVHQHFHLMCCIDLLFYRLESWEISF